MNYQTNIQFSYREVGQNNNCIDIFLNSNTFSDQNKKSQPI